MNHNSKLRFAHVFDKKETMYDKINDGIVGKRTKEIVTNFVSGIKNYPHHHPGWHPWLRVKTEVAAMLIVDQEIPIQPISKKSTNGQ